MNYKGYQAEFVYDEQDRVYTGRVAGIRGLVMFEASTVRELEREFRTSVDSYLEWCSELGVPPEKPAPEQRRAAS